MRICSGISYVVAYSVFVMLYGIPSHHYIATAASTTEDHDLQTKVLLHRVPEKIEATSTAKVKPVEGVLSEEEEKEVEPSQNSIKLLFKSNHGRDGPIPFETNGAGHDAAMQHSCIQNPKAKFWNGKTKVNKKGQIRAVKKQCKWLEKAGTWKINKFCGLTDSFDLGWTSIPPAKNVCFETCNSCQTSNPTSSPTEDTYDMFVTTDELKDAVSDYCANPEAWTINSKYAKYGPIEEWDVSSIDDMSLVFYGQSNCNPNIADWDVSGVETFRGMFASAYSFNQDIGGWDVSNGQGFNYMFYSATLFNQDIGEWDVSKGTDFWFMFYHASSFNQDIGGWDVSSGTGFNWMFHSASSFNQDLCDWDIDDSAGTTYFCLYAFSCGACSF